MAKGEMAAGCGKNGSRHYTARDLADPPVPSRRFSNRTIRRNRFRLRQPRVLKWLTLYPLLLWTRRRRAGEQTMEAVLNWLPQMVRVKPEASHDAFAGRLAMYLSGFPYGNAPLPVLPDSSDLDAILLRWLNPCFARLHRIYGKLNERQTLTHGLVKAGFAQGAQSLRCMLFSTRIS